VFSRTSRAPDDKSFLLLVPPAAPAARAAQESRGTAARCRLRRLRAFAADYPMATCALAYGGTKRFTEGAIEVVPIDARLAELPERLA
jgi:hypothetical protein